MLSRRRIHPFSAELFLSNHYLALSNLHYPAYIEPKDIFCLAAISYLQRITNDLVMNMDASILLCEGQKTTGKRIERLRNAGYVENVPRINVTQVGEYVIRAYQIELSRLINNTKLSKWRRIKDSNDPRSKLLRKAARKGAKLY